MGQNYDAIVIGCGPAGSPAPPCSRQRAAACVVLEREKFPRYHIGESLIPYTYFPLERLGLDREDEGSHFTQKYSVQFVSPDGRASHPFYFFKHLKHEAANTWQVLRSEFDQMLMDNAREKGAEVIEEITVRETIQENGYVTGVRAVNKAGETRGVPRADHHGCHRARRVLRDRNGWKVRDPYLNKIAIWTYYKGAMRDPGVDEGATTIAYVPDKGWFWYIPLAGDVVSVGIVAEKDYLYNGSKDLAEIFHREVGNNKWVEQHLAVGEQFGPYRVTGEYSYRSRYCAANGLVLIGDAFAFLDPVFSSGVFIASAQRRARRRRRGPGVDRRRLLGGALRSLWRATCAAASKRMRRLVYAFYDHAFSFRTFVNTYPDLAGDLTDCLIGNLFIDFDPLFNAVAEFRQSAARRSHRPAPGRGPVTLVAYEFKIVREVEFSDTDMAGIMHFSNFFRFMEAAEHAFFRSLGLSIHTPIRSPWAGRACMPIAISAIRCVSRIPSRSGFWYARSARRAWSTRSIFRKLNGQPQGKLRAERWRWLA